MNSRPLLNSGNPDKKINAIDYSLKQLWDKVNKLRNTTSTSISSDVALQNHNHTSSDITDFDSAVRAICDALYVTLSSGKMIAFGVFEDDEEVGISNGMVGIPIGWDLNGMAFSSLTAVVGTAGVSSSTDVIVRRRRVGEADTYIMSSATKIDGGSTFSVNGTPDPLNNVVFVGDMLFVDVTGVNTIAPRGLSVILKFIPR